MKKFLLTCMSVLAVSVANAQGVESPTPVFATIFDGTTTAGDNTRGVVVGKDNLPVWFFTGGSKDGMLDISYNGDVIFQGASYTGTSQNNNLAIIKTNGNGEKEWVVYSNSNDLSNSDGGIVALSDGGYAFSVKVRITDGDAAWTPFTIVDAKGNKHEISWSHADTNRYYKSVVGKISSEGELLWTKDITASYYLDGTTTFCADAISVNAMAADNDGNFYVGGNFRTTMTVEGSSIQLVPNNVATWNGNAQSNVGDMFVLEFDGTGSLVKSITSGGEAVMASTVGLYYDDALYVNMLVYKKAGSAVTIGGKEFTPEGDMTPVFVKLDNDFTAEWVNAVKVETVGGYGWQNVTMTKSGSNIFASATARGKFFKGDEVACATAVGVNRDGVILKINAQDGSLLAGRTGQEDGYNTNGKNMGYTGILVAADKPSKVYVYGYDLMLAKELFLREYDADTLVSSSECKLASSTGMTTGLYLAYDPISARIYTLLRTNQAVTLNNNQTTAKPTTWAMFAMGFNMPEEFKTDVAGVAAVDNALTVTGGYGQLNIINNGEPTSVSVYDLSGKKVATIVAQEGVTFVSLPAGFYVAAGRKVIVK